MTVLLTGLPWSRGARLISSPRRSAEWSKRLLAVLDADKNGTLDFSEWGVLYDVVPGAEAGAARAAFDAAGDETGAM